MLVLGLGAVRKENRLGAVVGPFGECHRCGERAIPGRGGCPDGTVSDVLGVPGGRTGNHPGRIVAGRTVAEARSMTWRGPGTWKEQENLGSLS